MKRAFLRFILSQLVCSSCFAQIQVANLLCENRDNPIGIDEPRPGFSWELISGERNVMQMAYQLRVGKSEVSLEKDSELVWDSGKMRSDVSVRVLYSGTALASLQKYFWQVRTWDNAGNASGWSSPAYLQMGMLDSTDWKAQWIEAGSIEDTSSRLCPYLRKGFALRRSIQSGTLVVTAHGLYEASVNGKRVGDAYFTPGFTSYHKRLQYQTYDVTSMLRTGRNAIGVVLADGWYRGDLGWGGRRDVYGKDLALLLQLHITYEDGTSEDISSDDTWKSSTGAIRTSSIYNGETIDARQEKVGWTTPSYDDAGWDSVITHRFDKSNLLARCDEPVTKHETFSPRRIVDTQSGGQIVDFGQNLVGWINIRILGGREGDTVRIFHAEVLDKDGHFYTENLRAAAAEDIYILNGHRDETFEPHFTYHGFRYIRVVGYPGPLKPDNVAAVALYADMTPTGSFECSDSMLNELQHNIQWSQKGNFLDIPTDCPQRDERLGWTGDAQVFFRTAAYNMRVDNFFSKWLNDLAADQIPDGSVPYVVPNVLGPGAGGSVGWGDAATIIPWEMYQIYGEKRVLERQYPSMKAWVDYLDRKCSNHLLKSGFNYGDWLFYRPENDNDGRSAVTDKYLIAQMFLAHSTQLLMNAAQELGKKEDMQRYSDLLDQLKAAFQNEYVTPNGCLVSNTQTAYVLALNFDMMPEKLRPQAAQRLVENIKDYNYHLTTGFLGTPYLCHVLTRFGYDSVAYRLLLQRTYPSWLYPVSMGATTIWERWDGIRPDSTFEDPGMNSFNHYAYGAVGDWMYREIGGIQEDAPGYKRIRIMPRIGGNLTYAKAQLHTYYGMIASDWRIEGGKLQLIVEIPANTTARIYIPAPSAQHIQEGGKALSGPRSDLSVVGKTGEFVLVACGSGKYNFTVER